MARVEPGSRSDLSERTAECMVSKQVQSIALAALALILAIAPLMIGISSGSEYGLVMGGLGSLFGCYVGGLILLNMPRV